MKKIDVLKWGIKHIAGNHNMGSDIYTLYETGETVMYSGTNVPTTADVQMLAEDMGLRDLCSTHGCTVKIVLPKKWVESVGQEEFVPAMGQMMWKRTAIELGGHLGYMCEEYDPFYEYSGPLYLHVDDLDAAKDVCRSACNRTKNGSIYSVWEVGIERNSHVYSCQWSDAGKVEDITELENARYEEMKKQCTNN